MMIMNMMKQYLGNEYSENHLRNFCLYWMKAAGGRGDEWRKENDLDCLYFDGDLRADTLMSAWTPIKWVADSLNRDSLGRYFTGDDGEVETDAVEAWIKRERLEMGFDRGIIDKDHVRTLVPGLDPYEAKWLTNEEEISAALEYMIDFLRSRQDRLEV